MYVYKTFKKLNINKKNRFFNDFVLYDSFSNIEIRKIYYLI